MNPYQIIHRRHVTEKAAVLESLHTRKSNACLRKCSNPRYVFVVHSKATKHQIARAVESIYSGVNVVGVNTIFLKAKPRRVRGRLGKGPRIKKAIVTIQPGQEIV